MHVLGIMSGTSLDGVDFALSDINGKKFELIKSAHSKFPTNLAKRLRTAACGETSSHETGQLHHDLGRFYADAARRHFRKGSLELIGLHGQTIFHRSHKTGPATLQIGEPAYLAAAYEKPVVSNFRANDIAAGGEGAPLAPIFHQKVFARRGKRVGVLNLGGIANITILDWKSATLRVLAWDTGPANMLLDLIVQKTSDKKCDVAGSIGRRGKVDERLLNRLLRHSYFKREPPKSTGREEFGEIFLTNVLKNFRGSNEDLLRTFYSLTVESARKAVNNKVDELFVCGGGSKNHLLMELLAKAFDPVPLRSTQEAGWHPQLIEPCAFAYLAWLRIHQKAGNIPAVTGAKREAILGSITF